MIKADWSSDTVVIAAVASVETWSRGIRGTGGNACGWDGRAVEESKDKNARQVSLTDRLRGRPNSPFDPSFVSLRSFRQGLPTSFPSLPPMDETAKAAEVTGEAGNIRITFISAGLPEPLSANKPASGAIENRPVFRSARWVLVLRSSKTVAR